MTPEIGASACVALVVIGLVILIVFLIRSLPRWK